ncbi:MAG: hypothetical protein A2190_09535 [Lysobacterales bacterium RIFOXYA1_FULL_69_10]|nr:MAG: hypothetical protein A2190_09535 [Xanthomonadales bacterium RIFOXYA1_FULL_69_10]
MPTMRPLRFARRWVALWLVAIACAVAVSLLPASEVPTPSIPGFDKALHFTSYLALSTYASMLFASPRARSLAALLLLAVGLGVEAAQHYLTATRQAEAADVFANMLGVVGGLVLGATPLARGLQWLESRLPGAAPRTL